MTFAALYGTTPIYTDIEVSCILSGSPTYSITNTTNNIAEIMSNSTYTSFSIMINTNNMPVGNFGGTNKFEYTNSVKAV